MERLTIGRRVARGFSVKKTLTFPLEIRGEMKQIGNSGGSAIPRKGRIFGWFSEYHTTASLRKRFGYNQLNGGINARCRAYFFVFILLLIGTSNPGNFDSHGKMTRPTISQRDCAIVNTSKSSGLPRLSLSPSRSAQSACLSFLSVLSYIEGTGEIRHAY